MSVYLVNEEATCVVCSNRYSMWVWYPEEKKAICSDKCRELYRLNPMAYEKNGNDLECPFRKYQIDPKQALRIDSVSRDRKDHIRVIRREL